MAEDMNNTSKKELKIRHRGRLAQIRIYFVKFLRMFIYQSDWKVLPMSALIAGIVAFAMGRGYLKTMEGTMTGTFALVCVCIWNGCFNSIQVICREREVIKREHRSGMHISSYVVSHMLYQFILCLLQTVITIVVTREAGMHYPEEGLFTRWFLLDFGITVLLITYAADMMSLFISSISHSSTTAMTIMPFILVFQLVFSGGIIAVPKIAEPLANLTISSPGFTAMASQADVNSRRYATVSRMLTKMKDTEIDVTLTFGQILDLIEKKDVKADADSSDSGQKSQIIRDLLRNKLIQAHRDDKIPIRTTLNEVMELAGEEEAKQMIDESARKANYKPKYEHSRENIVWSLLHLMLFIIVFSSMSIIVLEFIDKDKR